MSTITKPRTNIFYAIKSLFNSEIDVIENDDIKLPTELNEALKSLEVREKSAEQPINVDNNSSKKGGFGKKINPNTEKAMRAMHNQVKQNSVEDRERE